MHIVILSDLETRGGAAIAASRLAAALSHAGHRVTRIVAFPDGQSHPWTTITLPRWFLGHHIAKHFLPSMTALESKVHWEAHAFLARQLSTLRADVVNVHNIHDAVPVGWQPDVVSLCASYAPTVWTLHDAWSFTGRCAYMYDCRKFIDGCDSTCPTPHEQPALAPARIAPAWQARRRLFARCTTISAVSPSRWLAAEARSGLWKDHRLEIIPYGLPLDVYRPSPRQTARKTLGIVTRKPVLLVVAELLSERRKGVAILAEALDRLDYAVLILTLGRGNLKIDNPHVTVQSLGYMTDENKKALVYSAADLLVHPAPVDNLPNVVMEAIACGTPVLAFPIGGVPDMVRAGQTGWLASDVSASGLVHGLQKALDDIAAQTDYRESCRTLALTEYDVNVQARRYVQLFDTLTTEKALS